MINKFVTKGLDGLDLSSMSALDTTGLYAHNTLAQLANTSWGKAGLTGAAAGAVYGGGDSIINGGGFFSGVASGAMSGAMLGAGAKGMGSWYSKNAFSAGNFMTKGADGYATSVSALKVNNKLENPFRLSNFTGE